MWRERAAEGYDEQCIRAFSARNLPTRPPIQHEASSRLRSGETGVGIRKSELATVFVGTDGRRSPKWLLLGHNKLSSTDGGAKGQSDRRDAPRRLRRNDVLMDQRRAAPAWNDVVASTRRPWWRGEQFASLLRFALVAPETPEPHCREVPCPVTISDNTNSTAATNGQSLHTHRRWFAAKNLSWRSRTRSWTPHGTPKEASAHRV